MTYFSLKSVLPAPTHPVYDKLNEKIVENGVKQISVRLAPSGPPVYGERKNWVPKSDDDFADGGAFPEIHVPQFPFGIGKKDSAPSNALALQLDARGKIKYDVIARRGHGKDKIIYSKFTDLLPSEVTEDDSEIQKPSQEDIEKLTEQTRHALEKITEKKIAAAMPVQANKKLPAQYIRYTAAQQGKEYNSGARQRIIRVVELQRDPMEPPRFQTSKKIPRGPPSPPAPVLHSPPRKITVKEQLQWKIPPCISNWKNPRGYTIPLDKRIAADGRGLQQVHLNDKFAKLTESLGIAERKAREAIDLRMQMETKVAQKAKKDKEESLRDLARQARDVRAGIQSTEHFDKAVLARDEIRRERHRERQRDLNLQRAAPHKRLKIQRERDISEQIALGVPNPGIHSGEIQYDSRLLNQSQGLSSGFGSDDSYNIYDKPWRADQHTHKAIYRPKRDVHGDELDKLINTNKFRPEKDFSGTDRSAFRDGPVQFERDLQDEDPFGLEAFFFDAKRSEKTQRESRDKPQSPSGDKHRRKREPKDKSRSPPRDRDSKRRRRH